MKPVFEITERSIIDALLDRAEYGVLGLSGDGKPYTVPVNFVRIDEALFFHGSRKGRKIEMLTSNAEVSFSVVESASLIPSFFSSTGGLACPATQFFKSVHIEGQVEIIGNRDEKRNIFVKLMEKFQPEGGYKPFEDTEYDKVLDATVVLKIVPRRTRAKFKLGQHLPKERFEMIISHLEERGTEIDSETVMLMKQFREKEK
ncbi:pyridoxamine 5'-phosphate oxidase family protein [Sulfurovum sp. NBC37-1]|uniref:pyridoxamine 5'-phosphate oxidase family protein n=1 Tax=Sulfurovum sp. (strain NBC37-1) TaxID=387093 RepID=UPI00015876E3|nr:pyridoxamine 5'-phosphate oxidase family protein [Sulfurovum sp. NBC37-1]BAF71907.1 conserved hypothetical protein [Sulfurovum sp. NBC37-1]